MKAAIISLGSESSKMTAEAMKKYFKRVDLVSLKDIEVNLGEKESAVLYNNQPLEKYDCIYAKGSFRYADLLRSLTTVLCKDTYMPIKASAFSTGHNKLLTHLKLQQHNIPTPRTYVTSTTEAAKKLLEKINYPIVMKFPSGTQGKGVMFADSFASASSLLDALATLKQPFLIQEYIETGGVDIRVLVVGDKVVAAMKRKAEKGEKRANIHAGGKGEACELDTYTRKIAIKTAQITEAGICAVDMLESVKGPLVVEINISPGIQAITEATKIDVADKIAKFLHDKAEKCKTTKKSEDATKMLQDLGIEPNNKMAKEVITNLDFRANRILLPEVITEIAKLDEKDEVIIKANDGEILIKKEEKEEEKK